MKPRILRGSLFFLRPRRVLLACSYDVNSKQPTRA